MKRPFPRFEVLGLTAALALAAACTPDNAVKPGAPVLTSISIVEGGGTTITTVTSSTGLCPAGTKEGGACDPTAPPVCESVISNALCHCVPPPPPAMSAPAATSDAGPADAGASDASHSHAAAPDGSSAVSDAAASDASATKDSGADGSAAAPSGTWTCSFAPTAVVLYTFDRLLDTNPFMTDSGSQSNAALPPVFAPPPTIPVSLTGDYASNGASKLFVFNFYSFRAGGPSLLFAGAPTFPTSTAVSLTLDKTKVLAKDGRTPFVGTSGLDGGGNLLLDGAISFVTQPLSVAVTTPPPPPKAADAGADAAAPVDVVPNMTAATVTFNNIVCPQLADGTFDATEISKHITVTSDPAGATPTVAVDFKATDGLNVTVTPHTTWPASSSITISVDATAADIVGDELGASGAMQSSFSTGAM
jgi:hypothetical protein